MEHPGDAHTDGDHRTEDHAGSEERSTEEHSHGAAPAKHSTGDDDADKDDFVEETSRDSYPGSDPPAW